jgi:twinkle protein
MKTIVSQLKAEGITLPKLPANPRPGYFEVDCPREYCIADRKGVDSTPLRVDVSPPTFARWKCRHCLWSGHIGEEPVIASPAVESPGEEIIDQPTKLTNELTKEALEFVRGFGITDEMARSRKLSWQPDGECVRVPYRDEDETINNALISVANGASRLANARRVVFYGLDCFNQNNKTCIIAHRELDAIGLMSQGFVNVLALPNGGDVPDGRADDYEPQEDCYRYLGAAAGIIQACETVIFAFDDGEIGLTIRQELARRIGPGKCKVVKFTRGTARATFMEMGSDDLCADINEAKPLPISGLYEVDDFEKELISLFMDGMGSGVSTGWPNVDELYTVSTPGLTLVTGIPNSGKSEWIDALNINLALNHGWKFAAFSPENGKELHTIKLVEKRVEMSADPKHKDRMSFDTFYQGSKWVRQHWTFIESKDEMPTLDWILERATDAVLRKGIKGLIIDPWNRIEKKMDGFRAETDYVAQALPRILRFCHNYGVHCWLVVHPKQQEKDRKTGKIPPPSLYDCAGSAHFVNMCDNGIVVHRSDSVDDATEIYVNKVRFKHIGRRGNTKLAYNTRTGRYQPLDQSPLYSMHDGNSDGIKSYEPGDL